MYEHFRFVADKGQQMIRVDKFLVDRMEKDIAQQNSAGGRCTVCDREREAGEVEL